MEIALIKRESTGTAPNVYNESETITKFEIMDGAPVRGESIPIRLFLSAFDLTPTYKTIENKFSVKYYLNLVLVDEDDRRYFKQTDITLWRRRTSGGDVAKLQTVKDIPETTRDKKKRHKREKKEKEAVVDKKDKDKDKDANDADAPAGADTEKRADDEKTPKEKVAGEVKS